ncbi:hypothetical protein F5Y18DRAFT_138808 [Xylariaceae sp. FL1019]|nr:hypothetical protein F5Y18DRAFT_138808 [Xylariaceae sp. FL1019]
MTMAALPVCRILSMPRELICHILSSLPDLRSVLSFGQCSKVCYDYIKHNETVVARALLETVPSHVRRLAVFVQLQHSTRANRNTGIQRYFEDLYIRSGEIVRDFPKSLTEYSQVALYTRQHAAAQRWALEIQAGLVGSEHSVWMLDGLFPTTRTPESTMSVVYSMEIISGFLPVLRWPLSYDAKQLIWTDEWQELGLTYHSDLRILLVTLKNRLMHCPLMPRMDVSDTRLVTAATSRGGLRALYALDQLLVCHQDHTDLNCAVHGALLASDHTQRSVVPSQPLNVADILDRLSRV